MAESNSKKLVLGGVVVVLLAAVAYFVMGSGDSGASTPVQPAAPVVVEDVKEGEVVAQRSSPNRRPGRERVEAPEDQAPEENAAEKPVAKSRRPPRQQQQGRRTEGVQEEDAVEKAQPTRGMIPGPG